jgi:hypothetical protein
MRIFFTAPDAPKIDKVGVQVRLGFRKMRKSFLNGAGTLYIQGANGLTHLQGAPSPIAP